MENMQIYSVNYEKPLFNLYYHGYLNDKIVEKVYIFINSLIYNEEKHEFDKIEKDKQININIKKYYPHLDDILSGLDEEIQIKFIEGDIETNNNVEETKRKICCKLESEFDSLLSPETINLWCENAECKNIDDDINSLYYSLCSKNFNEWEDYLKVNQNIYTISDRNSILEDFKLLSNDQERFKKKFGNFVKLLNKKTNLGFKYIYNDFEIFTGINPFENSDQKYLDGTSFTSLKLKDMRSSTINDLLNIPDNTVHICIFDDVKRFANKTIGKFESKTSDDQLNNFYRFFFPNINIEHINEQHENTFLTNYYPYYKNIFDIGNIVNKIDHINNVKYKITNFKFTNNYLTCKNDVKEIFNLKTIFNNLELSLKIPCIRMKDEYDGTNIYKLHKPAFNSYGNTINPIVTENYFKNWAKGQNKKGLSIYVYIGKSKIDNNTRKAKIITIDNNTYKIKYNDNTIDRFINKDIISGNINGETIDIFTNEDVFLLVDLNRNGGIECKLLNNDDNFSMDNDIINTAIKHVFDKLKLIDFKISQTQLLEGFKIRIPKIIKINEIISCRIKILLPLSKNQIVYKDFINLIYKFKDYFIPIINFKMGSEVYVYENNGQKLWQKGKIKSINTDGTYDVVINNKDIRKTLEKKQANMIKAVDDNTNTINLQYKNQTNFSVIGSLMYIINNNSNLIPADIIKIISEEFSVTIETAQELYNLNKELDETSIKTKFNNAKNNIKVHINYTKSINKDSLYYYDCYLDNVYSIDYFNDLVLIIFKLFKLYDIIYNHVDSDVINESDKDIFINDENDLAFDGAIDWDNFSDEDEADDYEDDETYKKQDVPVIQKKRPGITSVELERLREYDQKLFESNAGSEYGRTCQPSDRHPFVLSDTQKRIIDIDDNLELTPAVLTRYYNDQEVRTVINRFKQSSYGSFGYGTNVGNEISCVILGDDKKPIKNSETCISIKYGSNINNLNWYICPKIWCNSCEKSINVFKILSHSSDIITECTFAPKIDFDNPMAWSICNKCDKSIDKHKIRCPLCTKDGLIFKIPKKQTDDRYYPKLTPNGNWPCCFKTSYTGDKLKTGNETYITQWENNPEETKYSFLHPNLDVVFGNEDELCKIDKKSNITSKTNCYVRLGTNKTNSFINCIANICNLSIDKLVKKILENVSFETFKLLNKGALNIIFNNKNSNKSQFQLFCEYIIFSNDKPHEILIELLSKKEIIGKNINIYVIETTSSEDDKPQLICNNGYNVNREINDNIIIIKHNGKYENLVKITGHKTKDFFFNNDITNQLFHQYQQCFKEQTNSLYNIIDNVDKVDNIILDHNNYIIAIITNKVYLPVFPDIIFELSLYNTSNQKFTILKDKLNVKYKDKIDNLAKSIVEMQIGELANQDDTHKLVNEKIDLKIVNIIRKDKLGYYGYLLSNGQYVLFNNSQENPHNLPIIELDLLNIENEIINKYYDKNTIKYEYLQDIYTVQNLLKESIEKIRSRTSIKSELMITNVQNDIKYTKTGNKSNLTKAKTGYEINNYVIFNGKIIGVRCINMLFIPIKEIDQGDMNVTRKEVLISVNDIDKINDLLLSIEYYNNIHEVSLGKLNTNVLYLKMNNDKLYETLVLENGFEINLNKPMSITYTKTNGNYINEYFKYITILTETNIENDLRYELTNRDNRITIVDKLKRENDTYNQVLFEFSKLLNKNVELYIDIKNNILSILDNKAYNNHKKKNLLIYYVERILNKIATEISNDDSIFIKYNTLCTNQISKQGCNNNSLCSFESGLKNPRLKFRDHVINNNILGTLSPELDREYQVILADLNKINRETDINEKKKLINDLWYSLDDKIKHKYYEITKIDEDKNIKNGKCKVYVSNFNDTLNRIAEELIKISYKRHLILNNLISSTVISEEYIVNDNDILIYDYQIRTLSFTNLFLKKMNEINENYHKNFIFKTHEEQIKPKAISFNRTTLKKIDKIQTLEINNIMENIPYKKTGGKYLVKFIKQSNIILLDSNKEKELNTQIKIKNKI